MGEEEGGMKQKRSKNYKSKTIREEIAGTA
jgi:hypothetical protein